MQAVEAKNDLGLCGGCGARIEAGEWVTFHNSEPTHAGCFPRGSVVAESVQGMASGYLFGDATEEVTIDRAREVLSINHVSFDGATVLGIDTPRLAGQLAKVYTLMSDGRFRTLAQIAVVAGCLETSASARLRDLRKTKFGGHQVISRQLANSPGTHEYKLILRDRDDEQRAA